MSLPDVVTREEWLEARQDLLAREKAFTRERDRLAADRRRLPMVRVEEDYAFRGPDGDATLLDLFEGRRQLIVVSFMFEPGWEDGCPSCSAGADEVSDGLLEHLRTRDTTLAYVSLAPLERLERWKAKKGWRFPWYSSYGTSFNRDFGATHPEHGEIPADNVFLRDGDRVFHTYSTFARGLEQTGGSYSWLDMTALGRQEDWEEPKGRSGDGRGAVPGFAS